ncbi:U3 small nucleolar RNA-associated protein 19, partial [Lecanoromycetidae sp. Uapishka_2]
MPATTEVIETTNKRKTIAPWFLKVELLMDFLTDSFNVGGSTSLMALSGLFYLIQNKNLDYPQFYQKLYSLLDASILHSKHRSKFFRLLNTFLASTHLTAALVASFIKRLSRLTLHGTPSGIVVVVPWIYNLLKDHPGCTFMIHRIAELEKGEDGWGDPFRMEESDPMETNAIESSLWEIHMLQTHYHPNVATIAKIIFEQFTKHAYNLEDFLDHSYATMFDAELSKTIRKPPEIEYEIPKKIFTRHDADSGKDDSLLVKLWEFS